MTVTERAGMFGKPPPSQDSIELFVLHSGTCCARVHCTDKKHARTLTGGEIETYVDISTGERLYLDVDAQQWLPFDEELWADMGSFADGANGVDFVTATDLDGNQYMTFRYASHVCVCVCVHAPYALL